MAPVLQLENVGVRVSAGRELLSDLRLALMPGEVAVVAGGRGTGKSLLAAIAAGDRAPDRGRARLLGEDMAPRNGRERARLRRQIGWCAERPLMLPELSAAHNAALPLVIAGTPPAQARADAAELLGWLGLPDPGQRIGAARQEDVWRSALARALIHRPPLVILDEPLRRGAAIPAGRLVSLVSSLRDGGTAFLVTTDHSGLGEQLEATYRGRLTGGRLEIA